MTIEVPTLLRLRAHEWGQAEGDHWLAALPEVVQSLVRTWHLTLGATVPSHVSFISSAAQHGRPTVLKIPMGGVDFPYAQANNRAYEPIALQHWQGRTSVQLLEVDPASGAMLLEACSPGTRLADECSLDEADDVAVDLLRRLWGPPPRHAQLPTTADLAAEWLRRAVAYYEAAGEPFERALFDQALATLSVFAADRPGESLLHGDFHHNNILRAERQHWLVIDPLPLIGDAEYDAVMFLLFRMGNMADPAESWGGAIASFCARLTLDPRRVTQWTFVRLVCDALAFLSHGGARADLDARQGDLWAARLVRSLL